MLKVIKSEELRGKYHCRLMKELNKELPVITKKEDNYDNAIIVKQIMMGYLKGEFQIAEFGELVSEGVEENNLPEETNKGRIDRLTKILQRAAQSELRKAEVDLTAKDIPVSQEYVIHIKPDAVFNTKSTIEAVKYFAGKPRVTQNGKKQDLSVLKCPEIYGLYLYAKSLLKPGEKKVIKGSYYYLRKSTDTSKGFADSDFFSGYGGNVVSFEKEVEFGKDVLTEDEKNYVAQIEESEKGLIECSEDDCKICSYNMVCHYKKTPALFEKKTLKKAGKIEYTDDQKQIINFRKGVARVIATAGAGKTECVTERGAQMFTEGVRPDEVLFITFTDAGAMEMKTRIAKKCLAKGLKITPDEIQAMTFNSFAYNIVKFEYEELGFRNVPNVIDDVRNRRIINEMLGETQVGGLDYINFKSNTKNLKGALACVEKTFDTIKTEHIDVNTVGAEEELTKQLRDAGFLRFMSNSVPQIIGMYNDYQQRLLEDSLITFADQEPMMFKILKAHPGYLERLGFKHIIVDEFQDSNDIQMDTIKELTKCSCFESLMVVGDDSQSIYGFRHTSPENMINFFTKLGITGIDINLSRNRRSTPEILDVANKIEALNTERLDKDMIPVKDSGKPVEAFGFYSKDEEVGFIAEKIKTLIDSGKYIPEDIAVLTYTKAELISIGAKLSEMNIPWVMMNPMPLMDNSRVQAALSLADAFYQPDADKLYLDYLTVKYDGELLNNFSFDEINQMVFELKQKFMNMDMLQIEYQRQLFHQMLDDLKKDDEIYEYFLSLIYANEDLQSELEYLRDFKAFGEDCAKKMEQTYEGVVLTTAHSSKGLEWPVIINSITKYDNAYLHTGNEKSKLKDIEEKRRLLFVSLTRAKDELYVTGQYVCFSSKENGETYNRYLKEVFDVTDTPYVPIDPNAAAKKAAKLKAQTTLVDKAKSKAAKAKKSYSSVKKSNKNKTA
jgi:superfamily I DNA/RNA helicase